MMIIHAVSQDAPERSLLAACLKLAVDDARCGDASARAWLAAPVARSWLAWLLPEHGDLDAVHATLLKMTKGGTHGAAR
jgi:hypothetical protein